jgi:hypothetical protein
MTLDNLAQIGKLKPRAAEQAEIARLLADAGVAQLSADARLDLAYRAMMQAALSAMLANGYRPATSEAGHHQPLIRALPKTAGIAADRVRVLDAYRAARNQSDYRGVPVSDAVARECRANARSIVDEVRAWLATNRPDLT